MSYEYSVRLDGHERNADHVMDELRRSQFVAYSKENCVALKDLTSRNTWAYDLRVFRVDDNELLLEITNSTHDLYKLVRSALPQNYSLTEVEDEDELSLEAAFRLR
jgi:hypothetical protein